ncbi:MAG TPA: phosphodiester glycosidase family protein [Verrucomicrobium sp.]|nr:phosphodiester glycosidase family protein [Verrucomicrobium sp.]
MNFTTPGLFAALLVCLLFPVSAGAQWMVKSTSTPVALGGGAFQVKKELAGPTEADLNLVICDAAKCQIQVMSQPDKAAAVSLAEHMRASSAVAGCNGGYFTPEFQPLGLEVSAGARTGVLGRGVLQGGVFVVRNGRPTLLWRDEFVEQKGITQLLQAGPRLVNGGLPVKGLEATKRRARTFVLTDTAGRWAIGTCRSVTLRELSDLLATKGVVTELEVERALNLDGGSSTGLWWREASGKDHAEREFGRVRNFLAIVPKGAGATLSR